jgi:hypothetical protein
MADFGKAGKLTIRAHDVAALVNLTNREFLSYKLTVSGASPIFTFACKHSARLSEHEFNGHPKQVYEWTWGRPTAVSADIPNTASDAPDDTYVVAMSFLGAIKYTLLVEHRDQHNQLIRKLKDLDFESQAPEDNFTESLRLFTL